LSKGIKVSDEVYNRLDKKLVHRETFSHLIERLLNLHDTITDISDTLGPSHYLKGPPPYEEKSRALAGKR